MSDFQVIKEYGSEYSTENFDVDVSSYYNVREDLPILCHIGCNVYFKGKLSSEMIMGLQVFHSIEDADRFFERLEKKCQVMLVLLEHVKEYGKYRSEGIKCIIDDDIESVANSLISKFNIGEQL